MVSKVQKGIVARVFLSLLVTSMAIPAGAATFTGGTDLTATPLANGTVRLEFQAVAEFGGTLTYDVYRITALSPPAPGAFTLAHRIATGLPHGTPVIFNNTSTFPPAAPTSDGTPYYYVIEVIETGDPTNSRSSVAGAMADRNAPVAIDSLLATPQPKVAQVDLGFINPFDTVQQNDQIAQPSSAYRFDYKIYARPQFTDLVSGDLTAGNLADTIEAGNYVVNAATNLLFTGVGGTEYAFAVVVQDPAGNNSTISTGANLGDTRAITAVTDLAAVSSASGVQSITSLSWSANEASLGTQYQFLIYGKIAQSTSDEISLADIGSGTAVLLEVQVNDNSNTFLHTGSTPGLPRIGGNLYAYAVRVVDVDGRQPGVDLISPLSNDAYALASDGVPPFCPSGLVVSATAGGDILVAWTDEGDNPGGSGIDYFNIRRSTGGAPIAATDPVYTTVPLQVALGLNTYTDTATVDGVEYCYSVSAVDVDGNESVLCNFGCAEADASAPTVVSITANPALAGQNSTPEITVTVSEPVTTPPAVTVTTAGSGTVAAVFVSSLGAVYTYQYTTLNTETEGAGNATVSASGTDDAFNAFADASTTALAFDFTAPLVTDIRRVTGPFYQRAGIAATYEYTTNEALSAAGFELASVSATYNGSVGLVHGFGYTTLGTEDQGPWPGEAIASDLATPANIANTASATPVAFFDFVAPNAPAGLAGVLGASGTVALTWTDSGDAGAPAAQSGVEYFNVYRSSDGLVFVNIISVTATAYIDGGTDGTFFYQVSAVDRAGNESPVSNTDGPFTLDSAGPIFVITASPALAGLSAPVTLTVTANEALGATPTVVLHTPGSGTVAAVALPGATTDTFQFLYSTLNTETEGPNIVSVTATGVDLIGNLGVNNRTDVAGDFLVFDFTPPVLSNLVVTAPRPWVTNGDPVTFSFDSTELLDLAVNPLDFGGTAGLFVSETVNGPTDIAYVFSLTITGGAPASDGLNTATAQGQDFALPANLSNAVTDTLFVDRVDPNVPVNVAATAGVGGIVNLTWDDAGDAGPLAEQSGMDIFNIYRSVSPATPTVADLLASVTMTVPLGGHSFTDTSALDGVTYLYIITAVDRATNETPLPAALPEGATVTTDGTPPVLTIVDATPDVAGFASSVTITVTANEALIAPPTVTVSTLSGPFGPVAAVFLSQTGDTYYYLYSTSGSEDEGQNEVVIDAAANDLAGNLGTASRTDIAGDLLVFDFTPPSILALDVSPDFPPTAVPAGGLVVIDLTTDEPIDPSASAITVDGNLAVLAVANPGAVTSTYTFNYTTLGTEAQGYVPVLAQVADFAQQTPNLSAIEQVTDTLFLDFRDPQEPSPVDAVAVLAGAIDLTWTDQGDTGPLLEQSGVVGFNIRRSLFPALPTLADPVLANLAAPAANYTDSTAVSGTTYYYAITSIDAASNESPISATNTTAAVTSDASPAILNLVVVPAGTEQAGYPRDVTLLLTANEPLQATPLVTVFTAGSGIVAATAISSSTDLAEWTYLYTVLGTETEGLGNATSTVSALDAALNPSLDDFINTPWFDFTPAVTGPVTLVSANSCLGLGATATFEFTTNEALASATLTIGGLNAVIDPGSLAGPTVTGILTVTGLATEGLVDAIVTTADLATPANIGSATTVGVATIDLTAPATNTITSPLNGDIVSGPAILFQASVADNVGGGGIASTEFYVNGGLVGTDTVDTVTPSTLWDTTLTPDGAAVLQTITYDCAGNSLASATIAVTVDNLPPDLVVISRINGNDPNVAPCLSGISIVCATARDQGAGIDYVEFFYRDATGTVSFIGVENTDIAPGVADERCVNFDTSLIPEGTGTIFAVATDLSLGALSATSTEVLIYIDNSAPNVLAAVDASPRGVRSVSNGGTSATLTTSATDAITFIAEVTIDLTPIGGLNAAVPMASIGGNLFSLVTSATTLVEDLYDLVVTATDCAGNSATGTIQLIVDNSPPFADDSEPRYPAYSVLGQGGFPSGGANWQFEVPATWTDNELYDMSNWDTIPGAAILGGVAQILGSAVDNGPAGVPQARSGIASIAVYYQQGPNDVVPPAVPLSSWTHIATALSNNPLGTGDFTVAWNAGAQPPSDQTNGTDYYYLKTVTTDIAGNTLDPIFGPFAVVDTQAPGPITWLRARSQNGTSDVLLDWALGGPAPDNGTLDYYEIYRDRKPIFSIAGLPAYATTPALAPNGQDTLTFLDSVPDIGTYWYAILAIDIAGNRDINNFSNTVAAAKLDVSPPQAINDLVVTPGQHNSSSVLTWSIPFDNVGVSYYNIFRKEQTTVLVDSDPTDLIGDLVPANKIAEAPFDLRETKVVNERAALVNGVPDSIVLLAEPVDAPSVTRVFNETTNVSYGVVSVSGKTVVLSTGPAAPAPVPGDIVRVDYLTAKVFFFDTQAVPGKTYAYAVQAVDAAGNLATISTGINTGSTPILEDTVAQAVDVTRPAAINNMVASAVAATTDILLEWFVTPNDNAGVASYNVYRSTSPITDLKDPKVKRVHGFGPEFVVPTSATQTFNLAAAGFDPATFRAVDTVRWVVMGQSGTVAPVVDAVSGVADLIGIATSTYAGGVFLDNLRFTYAPGSLYDAGTGTYGQQLSFVDSFADAYAPAEVENKKFYYAVTAVDLMGNEALMGNADSATVNDITPPPVPDAALIVLEQNAPGKVDNLFGRPGAVEPLAEVRAFGVVELPGGGTQWVLLTTNNPVYASLDGSFPRISLGDNFTAEVWVIARDAAGNESAPAGPFANDIVAPPTPVVQNLLGIFNRVDENPPGSADVARGTVDTSGEPGGTVTVRVYREAALTAIINSGPTAGAFALPIGDNTVPVVYVTAIDAAGNESAPAIAENDIVPPDAPNLVVVAANPPGTNDTVSGEVDPDVETVWLYRNASLTNLILSSAVAGQAFGPLSIGDNGNGVGIGIVYVTAKDAAGNESNAVAAVNDITSPTVFDVKVAQNFPGWDDTVDVQTEPNARLDIFSGNVNVTFDSLAILEDGFANPAGLAVAPNGDVLVTDRNGGQGPVGELIRLALDASGNVTGRTTALGGIIRPSGVTVDPAGNIYLGHSAPGQTVGRIARIDSGGAVTPDYVTTVNFGPDAVGPDIIGPVFDSPTTFVFTSRMSTSVFRVDTTAVTPTAVKVPGAANRFASPRALAVDRFGSIYVADYRGGDGADVITKTDAFGNYSIAATGLDTPTALAVDTEGSFWVIQNIDDGQRVGVTLVRPSGFRRDMTDIDLAGEAFGLVFDNRTGEGNVLVSATAADAVYRVALGKAGANPALPAPVVTRGFVSTNLLFTSNGVVDNAGRFLGYSIGDNLVNMIGVVARDAAGNWSETYWAENDSLAPPTPYAEIAMNAPGTNDSVSGVAELGATIRVYADANLTNLIASTVASRRDGTFAGLFIGDNLYSTLWVTAEDRWGNESRSTRVENDIFTPDPDPDRIVVIENRPGTEDRIFGLVLAVEPFATVNLYSNPQLTRLIGTGTADAFGAFASIPFGDNETGIVYLQAVDRAGNRSGVVDFYNDIVPPMTPIAEKVIVRNNPKGTVDMVEGLKDAVDRNDDFVLLYAYSRSNLTGAIPGWPIPVNNDGSFGVAGSGYSVGDNYWDPVGLRSIGPAGVENMVYLVSEDSAGNRGPALAVPVDASITILNDPTRFVVTESQPGVADLIRGLQGSVEPGATVRLHSLAPPTGVVTANGLLNTTIGSLDGSFDNVPAGDDVDPIYVQLVDAAGNVSNTLAVPNDITPPSAPNAANIAVVMNAPGRQDLIYGRPGAVNTMVDPDVASVRVYALPNRGQFLGELPVNRDGSFPQLAIGDNQYGVVYVTALDRSRNESVSSGPVVNDITPPPAPSVLVTMNAPGANDLVSGTVPVAGSAQTVNVALTPGAVLPVNAPSVSVNKDAASFDADITVINLAPLANDFSYEAWLVGNFQAANETDFVSLGKFNVEENGNLILLDVAGQNPVFINETTFSFSQQGGIHVDDAGNVTDLVVPVLPLDIADAAFIVSVEPAGDNDYVPSDSKLLVAAMDSDGTDYVAQFPQASALAAASGLASFSVNASGQNDGQVTLTFAGLPALTFSGAPNGFDYQAWAVSGMTVTSLGKFDIGAGGEILNTDGSPRSNVFDAGLDLTTQVAFALTVEPSPDDQLAADAANAYLALTGAIDIPMSGDAVSVVVFDDAGLDDIFVDGAVSNGDWGPLSIGDNRFSEVYVRSFDAAGNASTPVVAFNDIVPPAPPDVRVIMNAPGTADEVVGYAEANATVTVYANDTLTEVIARGFTDSQTIIHALSGGNLTIGDNRYAAVWVTSTDQAGNEGAPALILNDIQPPARPSLDNLVLEQVGTPFDDALFGLAGAVDANEDFLWVRVFNETPFVFANEINRTVANEAGGFAGLLVGNNYWNPATGQSVGLDRIYVLTEDLAGNLSNAVALDLDVWTQTPDRNRMTVNTNPPGTFDTVQAREGAVEAGSRIFIYADSALTQLAATGMASDDGGFEPIPFGDNVDPFWLEAVDAAGNRSGAIQLRNLAAAPPRPEINALLVIANAPGTDDLVVGRAGAVSGVLVRIFANADGTNLIGEAPVAADGSFAAISIGDNLYDRVYAAAVDAAGNQSDTVELLNDIVAPPAPTVVVAENAPGTPDLVSGTLSGDAVSVNVYADAGLTQIVTSGPRIGDGYGWLSIGDNAHSVIYVTAVDAAGNESTAAVGVGTNDITPPNAPAIFVQANAPGTADVVNGFTEAGATVSVYAVTSNGPDFIGETVATAGGTFALAIGDNAVETVLVYATDAAGNRSAGSTATNDIVPPAPVLLSAISVLNNPYDLPDELVSRPGAVSADTARVVVYSNAALTQQVAVRSIAPGETWFAPVNIGNDQYNRLYLVALDAAGNPAPAVEVVIGLQYAVLDGFGGIYYGSSQGLFVGPQLQEPWASDLEFPNGTPWTTYVLSADGQIYTHGDGPVMPATVDYRGFPSLDLEPVWNADDPFAVAGYVLTVTEILFINVPDFGQDEGNLLNRDLELKFSAPGVVAGYYVLNELGEIKSYGSVPALTGPSLGIPIARDLQLVSSDVNGPDGGYVLDGAGVLHTLGSAPVHVAPYFGFDIARKVKLTHTGDPADGLYILDGFGGIHALGNASPLVGAPYFGWDIVEDLEILKWRR